MKGKQSVVIRKVNGIQNQMNEVFVILKNKDEIVITANNERKFI